MLIYEQTAENNIVAEDDKILAKLPFSIYLEDFRMEYYSSRSYLLVENQSGDIRQIPDEVGAELNLNEGKMKIVSVFRNFKIDISNDKKVATDAAGAGMNPAIEINIELPSGISKQKFIFARFLQKSYSEDGLKFTYVSQQTPAVKDYFSDVILLEEEKQIAKKTIEVNHPLHYGGYHFYQSSYDPEREQYTVLTVYSDSGLNMVYAGYLMLTLGVLWQFWLRHIGGYFRRRLNGD